jgi:hypothetical protein
MCGLEQPALIYLADLVPRQSCPRYRDEHPRQVPAYASMCGERTAVPSHRKSYRDAEDAHARINGPKLILEPNAGATVAVTLHELATNAAKYGALSTPTVGWCPANGRLVLRWIETVGPAVMPPTRQGFGTRVMDRMVRQFNGRLLFDWRPKVANLEYAHCRLRSGRTGIAPIAGRLRHDELARSEVTPER